MIELTNIKPNIIIMFSGASLDFTNGATGFIAF